MLCFSPFPKGSPHEEHAGGRDKADKKCVASLVCGHTFQTQLLLSVRVLEGSAVRAGEDEVANAGESVREGDVGEKGHVRFARVAVGQARTCLHDR